jgi:hypothetical protein
VLPRRLIQPLTHRNANKQDCKPALGPGPGFRAQKFENNIDRYYAIKVANATSATAANLVNRWDHGTIATANVYFANSFNVTGTSSSLSAEFEDNDVIVIETPHKNYNQIKLNKVSSATSANLISVWTLADVSGANAYYYTGTVS